jgi:hypothetical protein
MSENVVDAGLLASLTGLERSLAEQVEREFPADSLTYAEISPADQEMISKRIAGEIRDREMRISGSPDSTVWQKGWGEVAARLAGQKIDYEALKPQYFHDGAPPCRLNGKFIQPGSQDFEYWVGVRMRALMIREFLSDVDCIVEFGCGTGLNILIAAQMFPEIRLIGTDWAHASAQILEAMGQQNDRDITGHQFDMLSATGWDDAPGGAGTGILTVHAMEQLHTGWQPFLDHVRALKPARCVHIEPILELYDPSNPIDNLARDYHLKRHYLDGYLPELDRLAEAGEIEIDCRRRVPFGGQYHEAYSLVVWRPLQ